MDLTIFPPTPEPVIQIWQWQGKHYIVLWGSSGPLAAHGPLELGEARAIVANENGPRMWDEDLADELDFAHDAGEVEIVPTP